MKLYRTLALAALLSVGVAGASFAGTDTKTTKPAHKATTTAAAQYECTMCKIKMSAKEAKAHNMKCPDCGMKLTMVKKPAPGTAKTKKS
jgi:DNA-directed RNA polymerase subunit RPC12/RpoP